MNYHGKAMYCELSTAASRDSSSTCVGLCENAASAQNQIYQLQAAPPLRRPYLFLSLRSTAPPRLFVHPLSVNNFCLSLDRSIRQPEIYAIDRIAGDAAVTITLRNFVFHSS